MMELLAHLRFMQLYAHVAHNLVNGPTPLEDYTFFKNVYKVHENQFSVLTKQVVAKYGKSYINFDELIASAAAELAKTTSSDKHNNKNLFKKQLQNEYKLQNILNKLRKIKSIDEDIRQVLNDILNMSQMRVYNIEQRINL